MIASKPVRLLSLTVVALVVVVGVRGIISGLSLSGDILAGATSTTRTTSTGSGPGIRTTGQVAYVLDGDTVQVTTRAGTSVRVRLLGISAPEIPHPGKPGECYGYPATRHLEQLLPVGTDVALISDPTQDSLDTYGRQLRYVEASGRDIGRAQIRAGAAAARDSSTPVSRYSTYVDAERQARVSGAGTWTACH